MKINPDQKFQNLKLRCMVWSIQNIKKLDLWSSVFWAAGRKIQRLRISYVSCLMSNERIRLCITSKIFTNSGGTGIETRFWYLLASLRSLWFLLLPAKGLKTHHVCSLPRCLHSIIYSYNIIQCYITHTGSTSAYVELFTQETTCNMVKFLEWLT
jgi:hypothetical protein